VNQHSQLLAFVTFEDACGPIELQDFWRETKVLFIFALFPSPTAKQKVYSC
jgi:hypothetical protein